MRFCATVPRRSIRQFSPFNRRLRHFDTLQSQLDPDDPVGLKSKNQCNRILKRQRGRMIETRKRITFCCCSVSLLSFKWLRYILQ